MTPEDDIPDFEVESAGQFNGLRVAHIRSQLDLGDLDMGVQALVSFRPGDIVCVAVLDRASTRDIHSMTCVEPTGHVFDGQVAAPVQFVNHACVPSMVMVPVPVAGVGSICFVAIAATDIKPGDEVTFAYHQTEPEISGFSQCLCSRDDSPCVERINGWNSLDEHWRDRYRKMFADLELPFPKHLE
ncbi:MAG: SET domain-containing protein [bacterium]|nr:SET domain-containing protein [bacterium]